MPPETTAECARDKRLKEWRTAEPFSEICYRVLAPWVNRRNDLRTPKVVEELYEVAAARGQLGTFEAALSECERLCDRGYDAEIELRTLYGPFRWPIV